MKLWYTFKNCLAQRFVRRLNVCIILLIICAIVQQHTEIISNSNVTRFHKTSHSDLIVEYMKGLNARTELNSCKHKMKTLFKTIMNDRPTSSTGSTINLKGTIDGFTKAQDTFDGIAKAQRNASNNIKGKHPETKTSECVKGPNAIGGNNQLEQDKKVKIGILIPSCTRNLKNPVLKNLSLTTICLPSLYETFEKEYLYQIYIGIDKGDYLESVQNELTRLLRNITVVTVVYPVKSFTRSVNAIARKAYENGVDYFVRINDDSSFETRNWTSSALGVLKNYTPPNVGVVGPTCKEGNTHILTHDMVHRIHFEIFYSYYPPYFDNKWSDDWITNVYLPERSTKLKSWRVKHHLGYHGRRYNVDLTQFSRLKQIISYDKSRLAEYLNKTVKSNEV